MKSISRFAILSIAIFLPSFPLMAQQQQQLTLPILDVSYPVSVTFNQVSTVNVIGKNLEVGGLATTTLRGGDSQRFANQRYDAEFTKVTIPLDDIKALPCLNLAASAKVGKKKLYFEGKALMVVSVMSQYTNGPSQIEAKFTGLGTNTLYQCQLPK